jgi:hypothetical protein
VSDITQPLKVTPLKFEDLIGQPTWIGTPDGKQSGFWINFKTVLRGDISVGDQVVLPDGIIPPYALITPGAAFPNAPDKSKLIHTGTWYVMQVHHFANFRQPDADSWTTAFTCAGIPPADELKQASAVQISSVA